MDSVPFTLRQLEYFEAIASEGSLVGAAARCRVSAPGLALALDELERHLGVQLFVRRKGKGMTLTSVGSRMLSHTRRLLAGAEALAGEAGQSLEALTGRFSIGCFATLSPFFLPGILEHFREAHPGLQLDIVEAEADAVQLDEMLLSGRIDVALLYSVDVSPHLSFDPIQNFPPHVLVSARHRFAERRRVHLAELAAEPLIALDVHPARQNTEHIFESLGLEPTVGHVTANYELVRCLVGRGLGYAVMFQRASTSRTYDGHVVRRVEIADRVPPSIVGLARPAGAPRTARYGALLDVLTSMAETADLSDGVPASDEGIAPMS